MSALSSLSKVFQPLTKPVLYGKKVLHAGAAVSEGFYLVFRHQLYKNPNAAENTQYIQQFCRRLNQVFNLQLQIHGEIPNQPALWVSNHISWVDVPVLGSGARVFFLSKAEVKTWPVLGKLAQWGGTLFIQRGSGDSLRIRQQITDFLRQDIPVLFFPEATTTDGKAIKKIHGRLLGAAIDAQRPVQVCVICYVNQHGQLDHRVPFIGNQSFLDNLLQLIQMPTVTAHLMALPSIDTTGHTVNSLTDLVQRTMQQGLQKLHAEVLQHPSSSNGD